MLVSIVIPTKNGERYLNEVLTAILSQRADFEHELVIVDSGSTDRTLDIIKEFQGQSRLLPERGRRPSRRPRQNLSLRQVCTERSECAQGINFVKSQTQNRVVIKLFHIKPEAFNHGLTRNFAISKSKGEFIALLTQDATPASKQWLLNIVRPMIEDEKVAGVFGRHIPRQDCNPIDRRDVENHFKCNFGERVLIQEIGTGPDRMARYEQDKHRLNFFSNTNSCIRRAVWQKIPFKKLDMAEDQTWAHDILMAGYKKAYAPQAAVYHSHNYTPRQYLKRFFDEYRSHKILQNYVGVKSWLKILPLGLRLAYHDMRYIRTQPYTDKEKLKWSWFALHLDINRILGEYLGGHYEKVPQWVYRRLSMQRRIIAGKKT